MNNQERHLPFLDSFRGVAILMVICVHFFATQIGNATQTGAAHQGELRLALSFLLNHVLAVGSYGVAIFFVVSGFCIHLSYRRSSDSGWGVFFTRRIFRLYPAYLLSLAFFVFVLPNTRWSADWLTSPGGTIDFLLHVFLVHNLLPQTFTTVATPYWSLAIEFQLYLLFPLLLIMSRRFGWRQTLMITAFVELVSRVFVACISPYGSEIYPTSWWGWNKLSPFGFWFSWSIGAALADAFVEGRPLPFARGPLPLWVWPPLVLVLDCLPFLDNFAFPVAAFGAARFLAHFLDGDFSMAAAKPSLVVRMFDFLGVISYSLYLVHVPLFHFFMYGLVALEPAHHGRVLDIAVKSGSMLFTAAAILGAAYLLFRFVETPGIQLGKTAVRYLRSRQAIEAQG